MTDDKTWTARQVAEYLQVSEETVYRMARDGDIPAIRVRGIVRFDPEAIRATGRADS